MAVASENSLLSRHMEDEGKPGLFCVAWGAAGTQSREPEKHPSVQELIYGELS